MKHSAMYSVIVGNLGNVCETRSKITAFEEYDSYVNLSASGHGRVAGESVYLELDGETIAAYTGDNDQEEV